ncbi:hypothetical protein AAFC00_003058 [Neodothiora populina]|uniref:Transcription initiation factor TFIID subunit 4 n=1 Tax=Neodothiora populina TaxID=2781224 RepID=A0ABR3P949_9PEZI
MSQQPSPSPHGQQQPYQQQPQITQQSPQQSPQPLQQPLPQAPQVQVHQTQQVQQTQQPHVPQLPPQPQQQQQQQQQQMQPVHPPASFPVSATTPAVPHVQPPVNRPYSPYQSAPSPGPGIAVPPNKRQRLSPNPSSPQTVQYASPDAPYQTTPYPNTPTPYAQNTPYNSYSPVAAPSPPPFNTPQPYAASPVAGGAMGPPPRPNADKPEKEEKDKIHDINDVTDVFHGSGIDLREEENYMSSTFRNTHATGSYNNSFGSTSTVPSPNSSFGYLSQGNLGSQTAFAGNGPVSQAPATQEDIQKEVERKHAAAARELAISRQQHLKDSFLVSNRIRHRMHQVAYEQGVALNVEGLFDKIDPTPNTQTMTGPNGQGIAAIQDKDKRGLQEKPKDGYLQETAPLADILTLVSVAANERLRAMLDDAYRLARARRYGSHGLVPPDLADLATGDDPQPTTAVPDPIIDPEWENRKRGSDGNIKAKDSASPAPTISFSDTLSKHLINLAIQDRDAEKERVRKRQERARRLAAKNDDGAMDLKPDISTPSATPAPETSQVAPEKPMTKKERERQAKLGQTEDVLHKNANVTAAMALGLGKKKKYNWMSGGASAVPSNPFKAAKPAPSPMANGTPSGKSPAGSAEPKIDKALQVRERKWGGWREDGIEGRGIQIRDWVQVLERDGREKKALQKALLRLDSPSPAPSGTPGP